MLRYRQHLRRHASACNGGISPLPILHTQFAALEELALQVRAGGIVVEVGVFSGEATKVFLSVGLSVHAIDPWDNASRDRLKEGAIDFDANHAWKFDMRDAELCFDALLARYPGRLTKRKGYDCQFSDDYPIGTLDAVYLDAVHTYEETCAAIQRWREKVKPGGVLCGHDYASYFPGVVRAVQESLGAPHRVFADTSWLFRI